MIEVRPMRAEERERVHALLIEAYRPYAANMVPALYEIYVSLLLRTEEGQALVAKNGEELLGTARLYAPGTAPVPLPPTWSWVRAVAVSPKARGRGVGQALMDYCAANSGEATALSLHTMDFMPAAIRLYERLGYVRSPEHDLQVGEHAGFPPEETFLAIAYQLPL